MADSQANGGEESLVEGSSKQADILKQARSRQPKKEKPEDVISSALPAGDMQDDNERKLADALALVEKLKLENEQLVAAEAGRMVSSSDEAYLGEHGGYLFEVGPRDKLKYPELKPAIVRAVDEVEAKRHYSNTRSWPVGSGRAIDTIQIPLHVDIKDNRRGAVVILHKRLSVIRNKIDKGMPLTPIEQDLLNTYEAEIHQF